MTIETSTGLLAMSKLSLPHERRLKIPVSAALYQCRRGVLSSDGWCIRIAPKDHLLWACDRPFGPVGENGSYAIGIGVRRHCEVKESSGESGDELLVIEGGSTSHGGGGEVIGDIFAVASRGNSIFTLVSFAAQRLEQCVCWADEDSFAHDSNSLLVCARKSSVMRSGIDQFVGREIREQLRDVVGGVHDNFWIDKEQAFHRVGHGHDIGRIDLVGPDQMGGAVRDEFTVNHRNEHECPEETVDADSIVDCVENTGADTSETCERVRRTGASCLRQDFSVQSFWNTLMIPVLRRQIGRAQDRVLEQGGTRVSFMSDQMLEDRACAG